MHSMLAVVVVERVKITLTYDEQLNYKVWKTDTNSYI